MKFFVLCLLIGFTPLFGYAEELSFNQLWEKALNSSDVLKLSNQEKAISEVQYSRLKLHWTPSLYVKANYMSTDNSGQSFFSNMSQRAVENADFDASKLNNPGAGNSLMQTTLGVAWPIYEGGKFSALKSSSAEMVKAQGFFNKAKHYKLKTDLFMAYGNILSFNNLISELNQVTVKIKSRIKSYKVGSKGNPVGYSGLLGLKASLNKASILKNIANIQITKSYEKVNSLVPSLNKKWLVKKQNIGRFINANTSLSKDQGDSVFLKAQKHVALALKQKANSEKSVARPSVGLFAEQSNFSGDRDTATSATYGAYLKWNFGWFSKGVYKEAYLKSSNQELASKITAQNEVASKNILKLSAVSLEDSLKKMNSNQSLLKEQMRMSKKLFRSGAMNAMQLSQLFSNVLDLIYEKSKVASQLLETRAQLTLLSESK